MKRPHNTEVPFALRSALLTLPLLLAACGQTSSPAASGGSAGNPAAPGTAANPDDTIPVVPRAARPSTPACTLSAASPLGTTQGTHFKNADLTGAAPAWLTQLGGLKNLRGQNLLPPLKAQANASLYDQLYNMRLLINSSYWGYSTVDLQALHQQYETLFRKTFGNLKLLAPNSATDAMSSAYIGAINDGHTYFMTPSEYQDFQAADNGSPTATPRFGFSDAPVPGENGVVLLDVTLGGPADRAGLQRGDTILSVNGVVLTRTGDDRTSGSSMNSVLGAAAQSAQPVTLTIRRGEQPLTISVTPAIISSSEPPRGRFLNASTYLLRLPTFEGQNVAQQTHDLIRQAQAGGATNLILDLRDDGGGLLVQAMAVAGAFVPSGAGESIESLDSSEVTFAYRNGEVMAGYNCVLTQGVLSLSAPATWTGRTLVLVNGESASGSEIVAQLLRGGGAALFGEQTYGVSNTVTDIQALVSGRGMAVTTGRGLDLTGHYFSADVTPSPSTKDDLQALAHGKDTVLQAALATLP